MRDIRSRLRMGARELADHRTTALICLRNNQERWVCWRFFFQAEDGIRDLTVTGVQTCALPISDLASRTDRLNAKQYSALKYTAPGTALTIGLPPGHVWVGGRSSSSAGIRFAPNLPTDRKSVV